MKSVVPYMKPYRILLIAVMIFLLGLGSAYARELLASELVLAGISIGDTTEKVRSIHGEPGRVTYDSTRSILYFDSGLSVFADNEIVYIVKVNDQGRGNSVLGTPRGLVIGDHYKKLYNNFPVNSMTCRWKGEFDVFPSDKSVVLKVRYNTSNNEIHSMSLEKYPLNFY